MSRRLRPTVMLASLLVTTALLPGAAAAQGGNGWVDPPRAGETAKVESPRAEPARVDPAKPAAATPRPEPVQAEAPKADAREATREAAKATPAPAARSRQAARPQPRAAGHRHGERLAFEPDRRAARRGIETPRPAPVPVPLPMTVRAAPDGQMRALAAAAQTLNRDYFASISESNGATLGDAPRFYGDSVVFHGRPMSMGALLAEKRRFVARWPERRYRLRPDSVRTACNAELGLCRVQSTVDFSAASPGRGTRSQGTVAVELAVRFVGERPVIVSENSWVMHRERLAGAPSLQP
ncbi:hypothetical protein [uncultured Methylobacterium sp.]|jgi:hypothetical protein|uniref:hypothetical protein n=1 Tax=uncultured Methylobacterium sp. TaxID=157278 RepID=UPI002632D66D|nr:hypothetical protein [uncultured Methylobacterium sp.]